MNDPENHRQRQQYQAALRCFTAARELVEGGHRVNGTTVYEHLGEGSLRTTGKYARLWGALQEGRRLLEDLPDEITQAYRDAEEGADMPDAEAIAPPTDSYIKFVQGLMAQLAERLTSEGWLHTQGQIDEAIAEISQDADERVAMALADKEKAEQERDAVKAELERREAEHAALASKVEVLQEKGIQANTRVEILQGQLRDLTGKLEERDRQLKQTEAEITRRREQQVAVEERYADVVERLKEAKAKREAREAQHVETIAGLRQELSSMTRREAVADADGVNLRNQLVEVQQRREVLEKLLHEQSGSIASLTGEVRAAEERAMQLAVQVSLLKP